MIAHSLLVEIKGRRGLAHQRALLLQLFEIRERLLVDSVRVRVRRWWQVNFSAIDAEKAVRFALGK